MQWVINNEHVAYVPGVYGTFLASHETVVSYEQKHRGGTRLKIIWKDATAEVAETAMNVWIIAIRQYLNLVAMARRWQTELVL